MKQKALDARAFALIFAMLGLIAAFLYLRSYFSQLAIDTRIGAVVADQKQQLWLSVPDKLVVVNAQGSVIKQLDTNSLGLKHLVADLAFRTSEEMWLRDIKGQLYKCTSLSHCQNTEVVPRVDKMQYAKLTSRGDGNIALTDNWQGQIFVLDGQGKILAQSIGTRLNHPNGALFTEQGFVQADTGGFRLIRWPYLKNSYIPNFSAPHEVVVKTATMDMPQIGQVITPEDAQKIGKALAAGFYNQPYFFETMADGSWWVLESGTVLDKGVLRQYDAQGKRVQTVETPNTDPISMTKLGQNNLILVDSLNAKLLDVYYQKSQFLDNAVLTVNAFGDGTVKSILENVNQTRSNYQLVAKVCLFLIALIPLAAILLFRRLGYDLNAKL